MFLRQEGTNMHYRELKFAHKKHFKKVNQYKIFWVENSREGNLF